MDSARILFSLPSELSEIKRQLIAQQTELKIIEQFGREKHRNITGDENKDINIQKEGEDVRDNGRIVIDVEKPKTVALNKSHYKSDSKQDDASFYQSQNAASYKPNGNQKTTKSPKTREASKKDLDSHNPTIFEIQRDENGALKVVTSKEDSNREKKMNPIDVPDVTSFHRPPTRGHGAAKKERKTRKIETRKCPVCSYYFPGLSDSEFAEHVDRHFEDEASEFFELVGRVD